MGSRLHTRDRALPRDSSKARGLFVRESFHGHQFVQAGQMTHMEWPSWAAPGDAVIFREDPSRPPFVVHVRRVAPLACATYAEAEAHAASYAERARANVWYLERGRLQLVCSFNDRQLRQERPSPDPPQG